MKRSLARIRWPIAATFLVAPALAAQTVRYVDLNSNGSGTSWSDAYRDLQDALAAAVAGDTILVADGTYLPSQTGNRAASFRLKSGVVLRGGYAGVFAPNPDARDVDAYPTILSGDLDNDDHTGHFTDNSEHVLHNVGVAASAVLDGFTIRSGRTTSNGAGMSNETSSPTIVACTFVANVTTASGGAIFNNLGSDPRIERCTFLSNAAGSGGGIACFGQSNPCLVRSVFEDNSAAEGGALYVVGANAPLRVVACEFRGNDATRGGGVYFTSSSQVELSSCLFVGNAGTLGGAAFVNGDQQWNNCTLAGNSASNRGGALYVNSIASPRLSNCVLWANDDSTGGGEGAQVHVVSGGGIRIGYSIVDGWTGAIDPLAVQVSSADPLFRRMPALPGDFGDLRLAAGSPGLDAGHNVQVPLSSPLTDGCDVDGDGNTTEPIGLDLDWSPRYVDSPAPDAGFPGNGHVEIVDRGAYEGQDGQCPTASATLRTAGNNVPSLSVTTPVLGTTLTTTVDVGRTGHTHARIFFHTGSAAVPWGPSGVWLVDRASPLIFVSPVLAGPLAVYAVPIPDDPSLCGLSGTIQARHFDLVRSNPARPFRLTNAYDLVLGR